MNHSEMASNIDTKITNNNNTTKLIFELYFNPKGSIQRSLFIKGWVSATLILMGAGLVLFLLRGHSSSNVSSAMVRDAFVAVLVGFCFWYTTCCLFIKRFRDIGISAWWLSIYFFFEFIYLNKSSNIILILEILMIIVLSIIPSKKDNMLKPTASTTTSESTSNNYIIRHWRGELSLAQSYWINYVLLEIILSFSIFTVCSIATSVNRGSLRLIQIATLIIVATIPVYIWQIIGCWKSSRRQEKKTKKYFWPRLAQISLILGLLYSLSVIEPLMLFIKISTRTDSLSKYKIEMINEEEIAISGNIAWGIETDFQKILKENPNIKLIHLNSRGGRVRPARKIQELIKKYKLSTCTSTECSSACVIAYMAGFNRILGEKGKIGFHSYSFLGLSNASNSEMEKEMEIERKYYTNLGLSTTFINKAFETSNNDVWYPSNIELIKNNVITHFIHNEKVTPVNNAESLYNNNEK